jgi:hypothetical protein
MVLKTDDLPQDDKNIHNCELQQVSIPKYDIYTHIENEKLLNTKRNIRMESQLGLTPATLSIATDTSDDTNANNRRSDRQEELGFRRHTFWKSCCGLILDRRATQFFVQVFIGASVMVFCMTKIWQAVPVHGCTGEDTTVYFTLLSALVGFYIPSPTMNK